MATTKKIISSKIDIFNLEVPASLIAQAIYIYQANSHQGISNTISRGDMNRTTKKVYKQKGTGGARHGSKSAPIFVGGGVTFGPSGMKTPLKSLNQKMKLKALAGILSLYQKENRLELVDISAIKSINTKKAISVINKDDMQNKIAIIHSSESNEALKSFDNIENINLLTARRLNTFNVAKYQKLLLTPKAIEVLAQRLESVLSIKKAK